MLNPSLTRLYRTLKIGQFIFVEDDFEPAKNKSELLYDFSRMNAEDRNALLMEMPDDCPSKELLSKYAEVSTVWFAAIDFSKQAPNDIDYVIKKNFGEESELYKLYCCIGEDVLVEPLLSVFTKYGVGITIPPAFIDLFDGVIRCDRYYHSTRLFLDYKEEIRAEIMRSIDNHWQRTNTNTVLILDNIINSSRNAEQMVKDLLAFKEKHDAQVFATVFSSATQNSPNESCSRDDFFVSYVQKDTGLTNVHRSIVHAAINLLLQKNKRKQLELITNNYNLLAENPELVDYLYSMANEEGAPGFEIIQQWISTINNHAMESSEELKCLIKLSTCLDAYHTIDDFGKSVPPLLVEAAASEFFSNQINEYFSITAPGDVFLYNGKYYVLVGQECDYMMGEKRKRSTPLCELLEAEAIPQTQYDKLVNSGSSVQISNFLTPEGQISTLKIYCNKRCYIRNEILNLCCFNSSGECMIDPSAPLSIDCQELIQPFLIDYYHGLQKIYTQLLDIKSKYPDFLALLNGLNISDPLIDYSSYEEEGGIIKFPIRRYNRIKERASIYLNKLFLDYKGRIPYSSIHLLGYEVLSVTIESGEYSGNLDVYIKQTSNRNKNRKNDKCALSWFIKTQDLQKHLREIGYEEFSPEEFPDDYIELKGKNDKKMCFNGHSFLLSKKYREEKHLLEVNADELVGELVCV